MHTQTPINPALPIGFQLQDYAIKNVLSSGGFSLVYLARDAIGNTVAIKEYLPAALAFRDANHAVQPISAETAPLFMHGVKGFFEEGRALAGIDHQNIVRVLNFFRANNTVYMVMRYERGKSLQAHIQDQFVPVQEDFLRHVFSALLNGLREVHAQKLLHLDIKPANIYLRLDDSPVLLDFGSARQALSETANQLLPSFTHGFAAPEQYANQRELLGPWSDVYSIGATMYACVTGKTPLSARQRLQGETLVSCKLESKKLLGKQIYSDDLFKIIDSCLAMDALVRPQSIYALQKALLLDRPTRILMKPRFDFGFSADFSFSAWLNKLKQLFRLLIK